MKLVRTLCWLLAMNAAIISFTQGSSTGTAPKQATSPGRSHMSVAGACERQLNGIEKSIVDLAEAMPAEKFDFTPESLHIQGSAYTGVRTFAGQAKHLATDNYAIWSPLTGDPMPAGIKNVNGPEELKSKAEIVKFLKDSFALGHKAIATLTAENATEMIPFRGNKLPRLDLAFYALTHASEHYGQMVVYLRMVGILPPASRPR